MTIPYRGRQKLREILAGNNAADKWLAAMAGVEPQSQSVIKEIRHREPRPKSDYGADGFLLEAPILKAVRAYLRLCPRVAWAWRINSGTFKEDDRYIKANYCVKGDGIIVDVIGQMIDGRSFAIETKAGGWRKPTDERERDQEAFLATVRRNGGLACFAISTDDVIAAGIR